jgi:hypothetical protein
MNVKELQSTITDGELISGEMTITFERIPMDAFLRYRKTIREITGFGQIGINHTRINEIALVNMVREERKPKDDAMILPPPPLVPEPPKRVVKKRPYLSGKGKELLKNLVGQPHAVIVAQYRLRFKTTPYDNNDIIAMFNRVHGIT